MMILKSGGTEAGWLCGSSLHRLKELSVYEAEFVNCYQTVLVNLRESSYKLLSGVHRAWDSEVHYRA